MSFLDALQANFDVRRPYPNMSAVSTAFQTDVCLLSASSLTGEGQDNGPRGAPQAIGA